MALSLSEVQDPAAQKLVEQERVTYNGKTLAACEQGSNGMVLARVTVRAVPDPVTGKRPTKDAAGKDRPTEETIKTTARFVDWRDAILGGLVNL